MSLNLPLIDEVLEQIDANPETWDQASYANECGTAFCVAGHVALRLGFTFQPGAYPRWRDQRGWPAAVSHVQIAARTALGLDYEQAWCLFFGRNTRDDLELVLDAIREGAL